MGDKAAENVASKKGEKPKAQAKEKEDRARERERKKDQEVLDRALEASRREIPKIPLAQPRAGTSRASERDNQPFAEAGLRAEFSGLGKILSAGFGSLREEFSGLKNNLSEGFSSINGNLETGFEALYYGGEEDFEDFGEADSQIGQTTSLMVTPPSLGTAPDVSGCDDVILCDAASSCAVGPPAAITEEGALSLFAKLAGEITTPSETSEDVGADLARLINEFCTRPLSLEEFNELKKKYKRPANCPQLQVPFVPKVIWSRLDAAFRGRDKAWQTVQEDFMSITSAHVKVMQMLDDALVTWDTTMRCFITAFPVAVLDSLKEVSGSISKAILIMMDTAKMAGFLHRTGITERRREALRPKLPGDFKRLAGNNFAPTETSLFGDIVDNVKVISDTAKLSSQMDAAVKKPNSQPAFNRGGARYTPYGRGRGQGFFASRRGRGRGRFPRGGGRGFNPGHQINPNQNSASSHENPNALRGGFRGRGAPTK